MKMKMTTSTQRPMTPTAMPAISPRESGEGVVAKREEGGWGRGSVKEGDKRWGGEWGKGEVRSEQGGGGKGREGEEK